MGLGEWKIKLIRGCLRPLDNGNNPLPWNATDRSERWIVQRNLNQWKRLLRHVESVIVLYW